MDHDTTGVEHHNDGASEITVPVNEKPVTLTGNRHTGTEIKQAAIDQGVPIDTDFVLSVECGPQQTRVIDDHEPIEIEDGTRIVAVPDDDNS